MFCLPFAATWRDFSQFQSRLTFLTNIKFTNRHISWHELLNAPSACPLFFCLVAPFISADSRKLQTHYPTNILAHFLPFASTGRSLKGIKLLFFADFCLNREKCRSGSYVYRVPWTEGETSPSHTSWRSRRSQNKTRGEKKERQRASSWNGYKLKSRDLGPSFSDGKKAGSQIAQSEQRNLPRKRIFERTHLKKRLNCD